MEGRGVGDGKVAERRAAGSGESGKTGTGKSIAVVIAAWNVRDHLRACLKSIAAETKRHAWRVTVVDNASTDGTAEMIAAEFPQVTILRNAKNEGFVAGTNRGLRHVLEAGRLGEGAAGGDAGRGSQEIARDAARDGAGVGEGAADYLLLLNADVVIRDGAIDRLADFLDGRPDAAGAAPGLCLPDGRSQTGPGGFAPTARSAFFYFLFISRLFPKNARPLFVDPGRSGPGGGGHGAGGHDAGGDDAGGREHPSNIVRVSDASSGAAESVGLRAFRPRNSDLGGGAAGKIPRRVDWLSGACFMVRAGVVRKIGLMDEAYFLYADDIDWGLRMTRAGERLYFLPEIGVVHYHGVTSKTIHQEINTRWIERVFQYVRRDRGGAEAFLFRMIAVKGFALRALLYSLAACFPPLFSRFAPKAREMAVSALFSLKTSP